MAEKYRSKFITHRKKLNYLNSGFRLLLYSLTITGSRSAGLVYSRMDLRMK